MTHSDLSSVLAQAIALRDSAPRNPMLWQVVRELRAAQGRSCDSARRSGVSAALATLQLARRWEVRQAALRASFPHLDI